MFCMESLILPKIFKNKQLERCRHFLNGSEFSSTEKQKCQMTYNIHALGIYITVQIPPQLLEENFAPVYTLI